MTSSSTLLKLSEEKLNKYNEKMKNKEEMSKTIKSLLLKEYEEIFPEILIMPKKRFFQNIKKSVFSTLEDLYTNVIKEDDNFQIIFDDNFHKIEEKYENNYNLLKNEWDNYTKNNKKQNYLARYRKHCIDDSEFASHNCSNKDAKFILVSNSNNTNTNRSSNNKNSSNNIEFVICSNCKKAYNSSFILCKCFHCDEEYYSQILSNDQNIDLFPATWKRYHCPQLINNKMPCIKCKCPIYLNMKTGMLNCLNQKCKFISKQKRILWTCNNCKKDFYSDAKVYNPLDREIIQKIIKQTLLLKHRAHPNKMPCCQLNIFFTEFYHNKNCKGTLYLGEINDELIVVCEKCQAINYYDRFIWTCPKCQTKFRTKDKEMSHNSNKELDNDIRRITDKEKEKKIENEKHHHHRDKEKEKEKIKHTNKISDNDNKKEKKENNEKKLDDKDNIKIHDNDNKNINKNNEDKEDKEDKEDDVVEIFKKNSLKAVIDSPIKRRFHNSVVNRSSYQNFRARRNNRYNTDKEKSVRFYTMYETEDIKPENKIDKNDLYENVNNNNDNDNLKKVDDKPRLSRHERRYKNVKVSKFKMEDDKKKNENKKYQTVIKNENIENEEKKSKNQKMPKLKTNDERQFITRRRSLYLRYKELKLKQEKEKDEQKKEEENVQKNIQTEQNEKNEKDKDIINNNENKESPKKSPIKSPIKSPRKGAFSKFLFLGNKKSIDNTNNNNNNNNFESRSNNRRASLQIRSKVREKISGKKSLLSNSSSSSSSSFSDKLDELKKTTNSKEKINEINENCKKGNKSNKTDENYLEKSRGSKNSKKSTKVDSKEGNKNENNKEEKENQEGQEIEDFDDTSGIEVDTKNLNTEFNSNLSSSNSLQLQMIPGVSDHLYSHLTKRINHILSNTKINQFNLEDYTYSKKLGEGSYGVIHCLINEKTKQKFALKKIIAYSLTKIAEFTKEFELVHICEHPNILKIYGLNITILDQTTYSLQVLMEMAERDWDKDIKKRLQERKYYTEEELISITQQLTSALLFMKEKLNITHRDIKPQNVLIFNGGIYKLADFGEAKEIKVSKNLNTLRGTELYMSPALYNGLKFNKDDVAHDPFKSDLFSLGFCLVYAATMNFNLLYELRNINDDVKMRARIKQELKDNYSEKFIEIITKMIELDEKNRYDFKELSEEIKKNYGI